MPFDFHNFDRLKNLTEELKELRYRNLHDIKEFRFYDREETGMETETGIRREPAGEGILVGSGFTFQGWDKYYWLVTEIELPEELRSGAVLGLFDFGAPEGTGNNGNFESLIYLNGHPWQAADGNHKEVFLEPEKNGSRLELKFRLWTGLSGGGIPKENRMEIRRAQIGLLDGRTDDFYYLALAALETYEALDPAHEYREWLLNMLVKAYNRIDYTEPGSSRFYESVGEAWEFLSEKLDGRGKPDVTVTMTGHTHIDVAWLWRLCHTREKAARSFTTVNRLMDRYGEYQFLQSQPQLYEFIREDYPEIYEMIRRRVAEGRWEPAGAMWVECDCNIASGESIIRQILVGKNFFRDEFEYESEFLWLPDVFGYSWALPQILKKSGIDTFMTTKISWNDTNRLPYDTFLWRGIDGTGVTAHFVTTSDPGEDYYTYNGNSGPRAVKSVWDNYKNKDMNRELLISYGYGDGGGGPNRDMIRKVEMTERMPGIPHVCRESVTEYFRRLNRTMEENPMEGYLPVWDGELYLEFHRGTYTSQAYNKRMNRRLEYALRDAEMGAVLAAVYGGVPYPKETLLKAWKIVLCQQFHDILPGSSIHEVYEDSHVEYEKAAALLREVWKGTQEGLFKDWEDAGGSRIYTVFNSGSWKRTSVVKIPAETMEDGRDFEKSRAVSGRGSFRRMEEKDGAPLPCVWKPDGAYVLVKDMEPCSFVTLSWEPDGSVTLGKELSGVNSLSTKWYEIAWNEKGQLTRIYDREAGREVLPEGRCANVLQIFEDKPRCFDAWELEPTINNKMEIIEDCSRINVTENELGYEVDFQWNYHKSVIRQTMYLRHGKKRIDFQTVVDWQERQKLLKTAFPADIRAVDGRFDIQNGNIRRPITQNTTWDAARFETAVHKWVDLWETGYGIALLNDCKYGCDVKEDTIRLSLLKSAVDPDYAADLGEQVFTYSLLPHQKEWYEAGIEEEAFDLNTPLTAEPGKPEVTGGSLIAFNRDNLVIDAFKQAEKGDSFVLRFHEYQGARGVVRLLTRLPVLEWCECSLMEEPEGDFSAGPLELAVKPYEIKTLLLRLGGKCSL